MGDGAESDLRAPSASPGLDRAPFFDSPFLALPGAQGADAMLGLHLPVVGSRDVIAQPQNGAMPLHSAAVAPVVPTAPSAPPMTMDLQPDDVLLAPFLPEDDVYMDQVGGMLDTAACFPCQHQTFGAVTADQRTCVFDHLEVLLIAAAYATYIAVVLPQVDMLPDTPSAGSAPAGSSGDAAAEGSDPSSNHTQLTVVREKNRVAQVLGMCERLQESPYSSCTCTLDESAGRFRGPTLVTVCSASTVRSSDSGRTRAAPRLQSSHASWQKPNGSRWVAVPLPAVSNITAATKTVLSSKQELVFHIRNMLLALLPCLTCFVGL